MSKCVRMALLVAVGVLGIASAAFAIVPSPTTSTCGACLIVAPGGEYQFCVQVNDQLSVGINHSHVTIDFGNLLDCNARLCSSQNAGFTVAGNTISGFTNPSGAICFNIHGAGSCLGGNTLIRVIADGIELCSFDRVTTPDFTHDYVVDGVDIGPLAQAQFVNDPIGDLTCDGVCDGLDIGPFADSQFNHGADAHCP